MNFILVACFFAILWTCDAKSVSLCSESELAELNLMHSHCIEQEGKRFKQLPGSFILSVTNSVINGKTFVSQSDSKVLLLCNMMHDFEEKCAGPFQKCLDEKQYR